MKRQKQENTVAETEICKNCKYFSAYYVKRNARLSATSLGICQHSKWRTVQQIQKREENAACNFWESNELKNEKKEESIKTLLLHTARQINDIVLLLKEDD